MQPLRTRRSLWWPVLALTAVAALLAFVFFIFPVVYITHADLPKAADRLKAQNDVRTAAIQALGGIVALSGAYIAYRTWREDHFSKLEERLRDLLTQLDSEHPEVRLAAIDGLGRLATESKTHAERITKVLTTWIRRLRD